MTETQWLKCRSPQKMLLFLRNSGKASERKLRLLSCACCRRVWDLLPAEESRHAVLVAERYADELASEDELTTARRQAKRPAKDAAARHIRKFPGAAGRAAAALSGRHAYNCLCVAHHEPLARNSAQKVATELGLSAEAALDPRDAYLEAEAHEAATQPALIRDLFGPPPFCEVRLDPAWLTWNERTVVRLAQGIYEDRVLPGGTFDKSRLAVLADALEEAGCADEGILSHLRQQQAIHVRGCWAIDLLLGQT